VCRSVGRRLGPSVVRSALFTTSRPSTTGVEGRERFAEVTCKPRAARSRPGACSAGLLHAADCSSHCAGNVEHGKSQSTCVGRANVGIVAVADAVVAAVVIGRVVVVVVAVVDGRHGGRQVSRLLTYLTWACSTARSTSAG
jgi:hypothetical protein